MELNDNMKRKTIYLAFFLFFLVGSIVAAASWTYLTEVASVEITVEKPVLFEKIEMKDSVAISDGSFTMHGQTTFYPSDDESKFISLLISGLSKEERKQFTTLKLHSEIGGYKSTEDLLGDKDVFEVNKYFEAGGDPVPGNFTLSGTLASDITRDTIGFKIHGCWGNG